MLSLIANCQGAPADGVQLLSDRAAADTKTFFLVNGLPTGGLTATKGGASGGQGGFVNLPIGSLAITYRVAATGRILRTQLAITRPGALTYLSFVAAGTSSDN